MERHQSERKLLLLAVIAGVCFSASIAVFFINSITFSIFPIIAFALSLLAFYQQHEVQPLTEGTPAIILACFLVGAFGYSAFIRMQLPDLGSNFLPLIVSMSLAFWIFKKTNMLKSTENKQLSK